MSDETALQQELIIYCGKIIETWPELFQGILVLRMGWVKYQQFVEPEDLTPVFNFLPFRIRE